MKHKTHVDNKKCVQNLCQKNPNNGLFWGFMNKVEENIKMGFK
jgi:hypothetical protein